MTEENEENSEAPVKETSFKMPEYAWPLMGVLVVMVVGLIIYFSMGRHVHKSEGRFVGPGKCKECHQEQYASWKKTRMATSFEVLRPGMKAKEKQMAGLDPDEDYTHDEACLPCHTTGYGLVGGFVSIEKTPEMAGVTCEACHGHGGTYARRVMAGSNPAFETSAARKAGLLYPPTENICRECHNARSPFIGMEYKFYYDDRVKLGTHEHYHLKYEHGN